DPCPPLDGGAHRGPGTRCPHLGGRGRAALSDGPLSSLRPASAQDACSARTLWSRPDWRPFQLTRTPSWCGHAIPMVALPRLPGLGETPGFSPALLGRVVGLLTVLTVIAPPEPAPTSMTAAFEAQGGRGGGRRSADRPPRSGGGRIRLVRNRGFGARPALLRRPSQGVHG